MSQEAPGAQKLEVGDKNEEMYCYSIFATFLKCPKSLFDHCESMADTSTKFGNGITSVMFTHAHMTLFGLHLAHQLNGNWSKNLVPTT
jgi:fructose/tagatose bisphosphate aldolase